MITAPETISTRAGSHEAHPREARHSSDAMTASTETPSSPSIQVCFVSLPMPTPWTSADAHAP